MELSKILNRFRSGSSSTKTLGLEVYANCIVAVSVSLSSSQRPILHETYQEAFTPETMGEVLLRLINKSACKQCAITLSQNYYQLMLVDSPEVPDEELSSAMKWKANELTTQPIEELVIDAFRLPEDAYRGRMDMSYAAIAQKSAIKKLVDIVDRSESQLKSICINETALANLFNWLPAFDGVDVAVIRLEKSGGTLCLLDSGKLYLCRTLEGYFSPEEIEQGYLHNVENIDRLGLDIQRSMDYYESQLGKPGIELGFIFVDDEKGVELSDLLNERLPVALIPFQTHEIFETSDVECDTRFGAAIGAALGCLEELSETDD
jgi:MSHA biogenesis protein MshI